MFLPGGHHRQPRNTTIDLDLAPTAGGDVPTGGSSTPPFFPELPYTLGAGTGMAQLEFWSVTDGTNGQVLPPSSFTQTVGSLPLSITAWYFPISGPGVGSGGPEIIDDAFSAIQGRFIDDTFVDVTSDPSLTSDANVVGVVPTAIAETLVAHSAVVSTTEPFSKWVMNGMFGPVGNTTLQVPKGTVGIAVAVYQSSGITTKPPPSVPSAYNPWWWIVSWWGHGPDPGPEWAGQLVATLELIDAVAKVSPELKNGAARLAMEQLAVTTASMIKQIERLGEG